MKKRPVIGLTVAVVVLSVIMGIATLPDEVLLEPSAENSQTIQEDIPFVPKIEEVSNLVSESITEKKLEKTKAELDALKNEFEQLKKEINEPKPASEIPEEVTQVSETPDEEFDNPSEGKVISINLKDGVGGSER